MLSRRRRGWAWAGSHHIPEVEDGFGPTHLIGALALWGHDIDCERVRPFEGSEVIETNRRQACWAGAIERIGHVKRAMPLMTFVVMAGLFMLGLRGAER